jgi:two-component system, NtrC family, sensor kinase
MKLVPKLTLMFIFSTSVVLTVNGYLRVRREVGLFESDRTRDHELMVRNVARAALEVWQTECPARAVAMIDEVDGKTPTLRIRWHPLPPKPRADFERRLVELPQGQTLTVVSQPPMTGRERCIYTTLATLAVPTGAISLCESLSTQDAYVHKTIVETIITTLTLASVCALLSGTLGVWLVGKPVFALSEKARRIGSGDFSAPLRLQGDDELTGLAREMNAMCEQLAAAAARVARETASRISAVEQLRHADRLTTVGKLASGLAHELGTPLNVIEARADMIASGETSPAESRDFARVIREASERMTRLIRRLLDFARPRAPEAAIHPVFQLANTTVELLLPLARRSQVKLVVEELTPGCTAFVDADQLQQVLTNLVVNAIQAMDRPGSVELSVGRVRAKPPADHGGKEGDYVGVSVRDHGTGIAEENLPHLFEPFFTTKDVGSGTGLGLAVSYGIVRDNGGWIEVETALGAGTTFRVFLRPGAG